MMMSFFSFLITANIFCRCVAERRIRVMLHEMSRIEVVVVPSLLIKGREYPIELPSLSAISTANPARSRAL